jgi:hypothetical protein
MPRIKCEKRVKADFAASVSPEPTSEAVAVILRWVTMHCVGVHGECSTLLLSLHGEAHAEILPTHAWTLRANTSKMHCAFYNYQRGAGEISCEPRVTVFAPRHTEAARSLASIRHVTKTGGVIIRSALNTAY